MSYVGQFFLNNTNILFFSRNNTGFLFFSNILSCRFGPSRQEPVGLGEAERAQSATRRPISGSATSPCSLSAWGWVPETSRLRRSRQVPEKMPRPLLLPLSSSFFFLAPAFFLLSLNTNLAELIHHFDPINFCFSTTNRC